MRPSTLAFDALPSIDDLFGTDPALAEKPVLPAHPSGDSIASPANVATGTQNTSRDFDNTNDLKRIASAMVPQSLTFSEVGGGHIPMLLPLATPTGNRMHVQASPDVLPPPSVELDGPTYVPVNADNDNGSNVTNGIPAKRDYSVSPMANPDTDLLQATVTAMNVAGGGTWTMTLTQNGKGQVSLWTDQKKTSAFNGPAAGALSATFYIEGTHESATANDVTLTFKYTVGGNTYTSNLLQISVTPLINSFTVTPGADDKAGQNVVFANGNNGNLGLIARPPKQQPGATFMSLTVPTGLSNASMKFIQNITGIVNGNNGTKDKNNTPVGWLYQDNTGQLITLKNPGYPILDASKGATDQTQVNNFNYSLGRDGSLTITFDDSPYPSAPANANNGIAEDVLPTFRTYVVVEWSQVAGNSGVNKVPVFYFVAYLNWQVNFYATAVNKPPTGPITTIQVIKGVTGDGFFTRSNADPGVNALDLNRNFSDNGQWTAA